MLLESTGAVKRAIANRRTHGTIIGDRRIYSRDPITAGGVVIVGMAYSFSAQCAFGVAGLYMRHRLDETPVFRAFKKQQAINHRQQREERPVVKVVREQWRSILLIIILRFAESVPFFLLPSSRFLGDDAAWDCQPDYSVHCNVHLSAGVSHARAIWHHVGSAWLPSGVYFRRAFVAAMAFPFSGCWKAVRSY